MKLKGETLVLPFLSVRLSVRLSTCGHVCPPVDRIMSALYLLQCSLDPFHIYTSYQAPSEGVLYEVCNASAFRRRRHYVFGLSVRLKSVCPSIRSLKYPLLTCTWVRWSTWPTVTVLWHIRPSVRLSVHPSGEVSGHLPENAWREWPKNFTCWCILTIFRTD